MDRRCEIENKIIPRVTFYFLKLGPWFQSQMPLEKINIQQVSAIKASAVPETSLESTATSDPNSAQPSPRHSIFSISAFIPIEKKINISQIY